VNTLDAAAMNAAAATAAAADFIPPHPGVRFVVCCCRGA